MVEQWEVILLAEVEDWYLDLCAQDPDTAGKVEQAILLVAGDKAGDWEGWYQLNVPIAEQRYEAWCEQLREEQSHD